MSGSQSAPPLRKCRAEIQAWVCRHAPAKHLSQCTSLLHTPSLSPSKLLCILQNPTPRESLCFSKMKGRGPDRPFTHSLGSMSHNSFLLCYLPSSKFSWNPNYCPSNFLSLALGPGLLCLPKILHCPQVPRSPDQVVSTLPLCGPCWPPRDPPDTMSVPRPLVPPSVGHHSPASSTISLCMDDVSFLPASL